MRPKIGILGILGFILSAPQASAAPRINAISVDSKEIFDENNPKENYWPFTWGNALHIKTKDHVIRRELLLKPGDTLNPFLVEESERNLRQLHFMKNAVIEPVPAAGPEAVDLIVHTQDTWTTEPRASFGTEGGKNTYSLGIVERNLLGYGKSISAFSGQEVDRKTNEFQYSDPRLWGTRNKFTVLLADSDDGSETNVLLGQPFYSLTSLNSYETLMARVIREQSLYQGGDAYTTFQRDERFFTAAYARALARRQYWTMRTGLSYVYKEDIFQPLPETQAGSLPLSRTLSGPQASFQWIESNYVEERFVEKMERIEDINLGQTGSVTVGYLPEAFDSDQDRFMLGAEERLGRRFGPGHFALASVGAAGRRESGRWSNFLSYVNFNYFLRSSWPWPNSWVVHSEMVQSRRLDQENQIELGGDTGLRGYRIRAFTGAKSFLFNLENRSYCTKEFWNLVYLGAAVFFDAGMALPERAPWRWQDFKSDVGFGLRFGPSRSASGEVARLDFAYALNQSPNHDSRWVISLKSGQAFQAFNNTFQHIFTGIVSILRGDTPGQRFKNR